MENDQTTQKVKFNLGWEWNKKISYRIDRALEYYLKGDLTNWFFNIKAVKFLLICYLNETEIKEIESLEEAVEKAMHEKIRSNIIKEIEMYDLYLKRKLREYNFLNPYQEDSTDVFN